MDLSCPEEAVYTRKQHLSYETTVADSLAEQSRDKLALFYQEGRNLMGRI